MRATYLALGALMGGLGFLGIFNTVPQGRSFEVVFTVLLFVLYGGVLVTAALRDFRGRWALPVGLALSFFPIIAACYSLDLKRSPAKEPGLVVGASLSAVIGAALLYLAWRFHASARVHYAVQEAPNQPVPRTGASARR